MTNLKRHMLWAAPLIAALFYLYLSAIGLQQPAAAAAGITVLTVLWWVTEALPIPATSLVPFALLPLFGVLDHQAVASALGSHVIVLLMGAFMLSKALEKSGAHERLALLMLRLVGVSSAKRLVFAFMLTTAFLSMWISNTATTLIMLPIALAILSHVDNPRLKLAIVLGIAYSASLGGVGTPIGTPPNVIFMGIYQEVTGQEYSFVQWMKIGVPVVIVALPVMALWLTRGVKLKTALQLPQVGEWRSEEKRVLTIFLLTALAWITRSEPFGGWSGLLGVQGVGDSTIALAAVCALFLVPNGKDGRLLDWSTAVSIPWGMLLLFAGGIAIAKGFMSSGLSAMLGDWLASLTNLHVLLMMLVICWVVTYLTEITSNTATATLLMPILAATALASGNAPEMLMIPAAICASCAFMLPVATAPNAIAYSTDLFEIKDMVKEGFILSFAISTIVAFICYLLL